MSNWFELYLDTTPPNITISAPSYISNSEVFSIIVSLNGEKHIDSGFQQVYITDLDFGEKYKVVLTFNPETNDFSGVFDSSVLLGSKGIINVYVRDNVYNVAHASHTFKIIGSGYLEINLKDCLRRVKIARLDNRKRGNPMLLTNQIEVGDTVRFIANFTDFSGNPTNVDGAVFRVYDRKFNELSSNSMHQLLNNVGEPIVGSYYFDFSHDKEQELTLEAYGVIDNTPALVREKVVVILDDRRL